jgi:hypothetical protein
VHQFYRLFLFLNKILLVLSSLNDGNNLQTYVMQHMTDDRENFPTENSSWFPFVRGLNDSQNSQKKYKVS